MSAIEIRKAPALPSIEKARALLAQAKSADEVRKIRAIAQAVATLERGKEIALDAGEIVLLADARIGELTAALPKAPAGDARVGRGSPKSPAGTQVKAAALAAEGLSRKAAAECEQIAKLQAAGDLKRYVEAQRKAGEVPSKSGALAIAKLEPPKRKEVIARMREGEDLHAALSAIRRDERVEKLAEIARGNASLNEDAERCPILYADPPWRYEHVETESRAIENQYPTMSLDDICALPVHTRITDDAVLFLWVTSPKLEEGMRVVHDWGFTYRTCMVWDKEKIGMGYYARQQHELLFICTRGAPPVPPPEVRPASVYREARGLHSAKPTWFYEMIERMYPELPKLEMFCREARPGWQVWGNQSRAA